MHGWGLCIFPFGITGNVEEGGPGLESERSGRREAPASSLDFVLHLLTNKGISGGNSRAWSVEGWEGSKDLLSVPFSHFLHKDVCATKGKALTCGKQLTDSLLAAETIWLLFWSSFFGQRGLCLKHIPASCCVYPFCCGCSLEMPGFSLFLVCENTRGWICHLASACPALHARWWKPWRAASLLVVPKGENEVGLTHQRLLLHPQFFQLHLGETNTRVPRAVWFLSGALAGVAVINKVRLYKGKCL